MKILKVILIALFLFSIVPINGYCDDAHTKEMTDQCTMDCHIACCNVMLPSNRVSFTPLFQSAFSSILQIRSYENPILSVTVRPPIATV